MGYVVDVRSAAFFLPRNKTKAALRALHGLARTRPDEFEDAEATLAANDLVGALDLNYWAATPDDDGNIVALVLRADKFPGDASPLAPAPLLEALSPHVDAGTVCFRTEADPRTEIRYLLGKKRLREREVQLDPMRLKVAGPVPRCAPGESLRIQVRLVHQWGDVDAVSPHARESDKDVGGEIDSGPMLPGEVRELRLHVGRNALGRSWTHVDLVRDATTIAVNTIGVHVEPLVHTPLTIAIIEPYVQTGRTVMIAAKDMRGALSDLWAHAQEQRKRHGGALYEQILDAPDLEAALAVAGVESTMRGAALKMIAPVVGTLPCSESQLLELLASFAHRTTRHGTGFRFVEAGTPDHWIDYSFADWNGLQRGLRPRDI